MTVTLAKPSPMVATHETRVSTPRDWTVTDWGGFNAVKRKSPLLRDTRRVLSGHRPRIVIMLRFLGGPGRNAAPAYDFPTTQSLLDALPQSKSSVRVAAGSKRRKTKFRPTWAPKHGGDTALLVRKQLDERPDIAARAQLLGDAPHLLVVLVGLPARGKSIIAYKLERFLNWRGWKTKSFSAGATRRGMAHSGVKEPSSSHFFDARHAGSAAAREEIAETVLNEALAYFAAGGEIAIYDASNASKTRRTKLAAGVAAFAEQSKQRTSIVFLETILTSPTLLMANMQAKMCAAAGCARVQVDPSANAHGMRAVASL
jgi:6-phosphofructo-2-kinase/fructose-2,6-biphosphatase